MKQLTESVKIWAGQVQRLRKYLEDKPFTIGGYISELIRKDLDKKEAKSLTNNKTQTK